MKRNGLPRYCSEFKDRNGNWHVRFRRAGRCVYFKARPGTDEFADEYRRLLAGERPEIGASRTVPGTINAAIVSYYNSTAFKTLSRGTQRARRHLLERFRAKHGDKPAARLNRGHVEVIVAAMVETPVGAQNFLKSLRGLMKHAISIGLRPDDPTVGVTRPKSRSAGIHTWSEAEIKQYEARHPAGTRPRLALALLLYTAQRRGDVILMGRQHIESGAIRVRQQKTNAELLIPLHPDLATIIEATPSEHLTFLTTASGKPFSPAGFGNIFRDWCREAGLPEACSAHGLRKAACRRLAEAGASANVIASISGHKTLREVERYTRAADQARMARAGMDMIAATGKRTTSG